MSTRCIDERPIRSLSVTSDDALTFLVHKGTHPLDLPKSLPKQRK